MLPPDQVLKLLNHTDHEVRRFALGYFADLGDGSPTETSAAIWHQIDQFGDVVGEFATPERVSALRTLRMVRQDDGSVDRAMQLLRQGGLDEDSEYHLFEYLAALPLHLLAPHREEILGGVDEKRRQWINRRFALGAMTGEQLWDELTAMGATAELAKDSREVDSEGAAHVIEALCSHPELAIARATETLGEQIDRYWSETWCINLLGRLRHAPAIDRLIDRMIKDDGDFMHSAARRAICRLEPARAVPLLLANYDQKESHVRMRFSGALGYIKDPLAETALIQLLETETDPELISSLCKALVDVCTTEGIEPLRRAVIAGRYDRMFADPKEDFVLLSKILGFDAPELRAWEQEVGSAEYRRQRRRDFLGKMGVSEGMADLLRRLLLEGESPKQLAKNPPKLGYDGVDATLPIRREGPKIGRNDPCPCGSGKKYKKCCGK